MDSEQEIVGRAATGDREAFGELAARNRPWLLGLCFRLVHDGATAEDLVQESLLQAYRRLDQLRDPASFRPWLSRIAVNLCRAHLRRQGGRSEEQLGSDLGAPDDAERSEPAVLLGDALSRIGAGARHLLLQFYTESLSHQELAETLSLTAGAVKSRLHRARARLRKEMLAMLTDEQKEGLGMAANPPRRAVLLVEPDDVIRERIERALMDSGYDAIALPDGEAALAAVKEHRAGLLILDKRCGAPHWTEVLLLLQVDAWARENVQYGVLVDRDNQRDILLAWQGGAGFCLTHPLDASELAGILRRLEADEPVPPAH